MASEGATQFNSEVGGPACAAVSDRQLVDRCLAGETKAWDEVYTRCHNNLVVSIKGRLGRGNADSHLIEEIAARVWYALVVHDGKLLNRFDPNRHCSLNTFLACIARTQVDGFLRCERRRRKRELVASRREAVTFESSLEQVHAALEEFTDTLTPRELDFIRGIVASDLEQPFVPLLSSTNRWQIRSRVRKKLARFIRERSNKK